MNVRKRFRRWKNTESVHNLNKFQNTSVSTEYDNVLKSVVNEWISAYSENKLISYLTVNRYNIDWYCFNCKKSISINTYHLLKHNKPINSQQLYCTSCRPKKFTKKYQSNPILFKYLNSFYSKVKLTIKQNSNMQQYL